MQKGIFAPLLGMKKSIFWFWAVFGGLLAACLFTACNNWAFFHSQYTLILPKPPQTWVSILGEPDWRIEWLTPDGQKQFKNIESAQNIKIELPQTWASAVLAWPYWPRHNIGPGLFRPCGALFPFDASGGRLYLSWKAGPDAVYFWELARACRENAAASRVPRLPHLFDWPRFRELFETDALGEEIRRDPWLADWPSIAQRTVNSGFDRRRLVPEPVSNMTIPVPPGHWFGSSPFAAPLSFGEGETPVFPVRASADTWVSREGILRCNQKTWVFTAWE